VSLKRWRALFDVHDCPSDAAPNENDAAAHGELRVHAAYGFRDCNPRARPLRFFCARRTAKECEKGMQRIHAEKSGHSLLFSGLTVNANHYQTKTVILPSLKGAPNAIHTPPCPRFR